MMNLENSRTDHGDLVDSISDLPDSILALILSYLPTKNAVATTILSKRWRFMWKKVVNLDFSHEQSYLRELQGEDEDNMKFVRFVNYALLHVELLNKFSLVWKPWCIPSQAISWINTAITRNVRELFLCLDNIDRSFVIPSSVFICGTLQYMELNGNSMSISDDIVVSLPRLESLKLVSVFFKEETFFELISGCPMLDYLYIDMDVDELEKDVDDDAAYLFYYRISSTSLRRLELYVKAKSFDLDGYMRYCVLDLEASSLEYIKLVGFITKFIAIGGCLRSSLVEADLQLKMCHDTYYDDSFICDSLVREVRRLDCAKALSLSRFTLCVLSRATISLSTKFKRLTKLEVGTDCCCGALQDFIQSSDNLEVLTIYQHPNCLDEYDHEPSTWITPDEVPRCLSDSLKVVVVEGYAGFGEEIEMIGYMLKHGSVLEVMEISCAGHMDGKKFELLQQICKLLRKSPACTVDFVRQRPVSKLPTLIANDM